MLRQFLRYLTLLVLYSVSVFLLVGGAARYFPDLVTARYLLSFGVYFFLINALFHFGLMRASSGRPAVFVRYYMGATTLKLFIHFGVLLVMLAQSDSDTLRLGVTFLIYYLAYTAFEAVVAYRSGSRS